MCMWILQEEQHKLGCACSCYSESCFQICSCPTYSTERLWQQPTLPFLLFSAQAFAPTKTNLLRVSGCVAARSTILFLLLFLLLLTCGGGIVIIILLYSSTLVHYSTLPRDLQLLNVLGRVLSARVKAASLSLVPLKQMKLFLTSRGMSNSNSI